MKQSSHSPAFEIITTQFNLLKLRIYVQFTQDTLLPAFKGSMLHGWFGHALKAVDEKAFFALYGDHDNQQPKPYIICPNEDLKLQWHKNELYHFDITLFGQAAQLGEIIVLALQYGQKLGFGKDRTPFSLVSVTSLLPNKQTSGIVVTTLSDWLNRKNISPLAFEVDHEIALHFVTPIRLKVAGNIMRNTSPDLPVMVKQIIRRLTLLTKFWVCDEAAILTELTQHVPLLGSYEKNTHCYFENWKRFSLKEKNQLPFGGLKGQISYYGEIGTALPWFQIGEQLHIGGKTTFGLGKYNLIS